MTILNKGYIIILEPIKQAQKRKEKKAMRNNNATYTKEQLTNAERIAQLIASIPEKKRVFAVTIMNAYLDGLIAGQNLKAGDK